MSLTIDLPSHPHHERIASLPSIPSLLSPSVIDSVTDITDIEDAVEEIPVTNPSCQNNQSSSAILSLSPLLAQMEEDSENQSSFPSFVTGLISPTCVNDDQKMMLSIIDCKVDDNCNYDADTESKQMNTKHTSTSIQSIIASKSTIRDNLEGLMLPRGNTETLFDVLRVICCDLKDNNNSFPIQLDYNNEVFDYENIESFLLLLGFIECPSLEKWECSMNNRIDLELIDIAITECKACYNEIKQKSETLGIIIKQKSMGLRNRSKLNNIPSGSFMDTGDDDEQWIIQEEDENDNYIGTIDVDEIFWGVTHPSNSDPNAMDVLLLTYKNITTSKHLLNLCELRMFCDDHDGRISLSTASTSSTSTTTSLYSHSSFSSLDIDAQKILAAERVLSSFCVQLKVSQLLKNWMTKYWADWDDKLIFDVQRIMHRYKKAMQNDTENFDDLDIKKALKLGDMVLKTIKIQINLSKSAKLNKFEISCTPNSKPNGAKSRKFKKRNSKKSLKKKGRSRKNTLSSFFGSKKKLLPENALSIDADELSEQLTIMIFASFKKVHPRECLKSSNKQKGSAPNILAFIDLHNKITKWVQATILLAHNVRDRARVMMKFIDVAINLCNMGNFEGMISVYGAFQSNAVYVLKSAWKLIDGAHNKKWNILADIMSTTDGWQNLRIKQNESHAAKILYYGLFAKDLVMIEETTKNSKNGSINWDALWKTYGAISKYLIYQDTPYNDIEADIILQEWLKKELNNSFLLTDDFMYKVSQNVKHKDDKEVNK